MYVTDGGHWRCLINIIISSDIDAVFDVFDTSDDIHAINKRSVTYQDTSFQLKVLSKHGYLFKIREGGYEKNVHKPIPVDANFYTLMNEYISNPVKLSRKIKLERITLNRKHNGDKNK